VSVTAAEAATDPDVARLHRAAYELTVAAAGAGALAPTLLLASVAPELLDLPIESQELDELLAATDDVRVALETFASRVSPELADRLRERMAWAAGKALHDRDEAMRAAASITPAP